MGRFSRAVITGEGIKKQFNRLASRSKSCFTMLCLLLLLLTCVGVGVGVGVVEHVSCSSSCGHLHDIHSPFRLKSDPPRCGSPKYEILCDGVKPMLELGSANKYYVTNILYPDMTVSVVDPVFFVDDDKYCPLPLQPPPPPPPPPTDFSVFIYNWETNWALFVNCTRPIQDSTYRRVPNCLGSNSSFVYVAVVGNVWNPNVVEDSMFISLGLYIGYILYCS